MFLEHRQIREVLGRPAVRSARLFSHSTAGAPAAFAPLIVGLRPCGGAAPVGGALRRSLLDWPRGARANVTSQPVVRGGSFRIPTVTLLHSYTVEIAYFSGTSRDSASLTPFAIVHI